MNVRISNAPALAVQQNLDLAACNIQQVQPTLIWFAVACIGLVVLIVAVVTDVGIPVWIIIGQPRHKDHALDSKLRQAPRSRPALKEPLFGRQQLTTSLRIGNDHTATQPEYQEQ